ncbi:hypothetical protein C8250_025920 [Streptomyces sp. So13.3]|uniref:hypothetical protein n=1 Tax=Streptomyces TaxID=1883 RepID=UPI001106AEB6|nr:MULTISPECIES: hypothetical protein [Streptomyces]QNA74872.1 hypothetical protein C8250_025920 [Streptomyces sp. So13.3]
MQEFDSGQVEQLLAGARFVDDPAERVCPACGQQAVRTYVDRRGAPARPVLITYSWCASCRRHKGWTGPDLGDLGFDDPLQELSATERDALSRDFDAFLRRLDALWEEGRLPQRFR